jgi:hypothetical protein
MWHYRYVLNRLRVSVTTFAVQMIYSRKRNSEFTVNKRLDGHQGRSVYGGEMSPSGVKTRSPGSYSQFTAFN